MLTQEQIDKAQVFHDSTKLGHLKCVRWRRNGATKRLKRNRDFFCIPVKHGLYNYDFIDNTLPNLNGIHTEEDCPYDENGNLK